MDTKPLEIQSESYIQSELIKFGFNVTKPLFDREGADLLIIDGINNEYTHFLKIQCKGRSLGENSTNIKIPKKYIKDNFIVFLYIIDEEKRNNLYIFFKEDIEKWRINNKNYVLAITNNKIKEEHFISKLFKQKFVSLIKERLKKSRVKDYTTMIVDGIFLENAIATTINTYNKIYPSKSFSYPDIKECIVEILDMYDNFNSKGKSVRCYVYYYEENLEEMSLMTHNNRFKTKEGLEGKIFIDRTDDFVCFEIIDHLKRIVDSENVILVADDVLYEHPLNELKEKNIDVTLVMYRTSDGKRMFTKHMWGNITHPLGISIGLTFNEL